MKINLFIVSLIFTSCVSEVEVNLKSLGSETSGSGYPAAIYTSERLSLANNRGGCAINSTNELKCWGTNYDSDDNVTGLLGTNSSTYTYETSMQDVDALTQYKEVTRGEVVNCAIRNDNRLLCWGMALSHGDSTYPSDVRAPRLVNDTAEYISVTSGSYHTCGITTEHDLKCFGDSWDGKLARVGPNRDPGVSDVGTKYQQVSAGRNHTCGITRMRKLRCWGTNSSGQVGVGSLVSPQSPTDIDSSEDYIFVSLAEDSSCAITDNGVLKCWGQNANSQVGHGSNGGTVTSPTVIDSATSYKMVDVGAFHVCAITTADVLKCWGYNNRGQIGDGTTLSPVNSPKVIDSGVSYQSVSTGLLHTCAIRTNGDLYCWGNNSQGDLGDGTINNSSLPVLTQSSFW